MHATTASYDVLEIPSKGSVGIVCIARGEDGAEHAIKVLNLDRASQSSLLSRARDEARMLSRLDHPNLVRVEPVLEVNGRQAVIMEYVRGANTEELLREGGPLPIRVALTVVMKAALGLDAAWSTPTGSDNRPMRIIHRDIKPGNLMIDIEGGVKVVDFGVAKASFDDREAHSAAFVPGSRGYMAPERYDGEDTPKGDVYALGLTLMELIGGKKPVISLRFDKHDDDLGRAVDHLDLREAGEIEGDLRALLRQVCSYDADGRPFTIEVSSRLGALLDVLGEADMAAFANEVVRPMFEARTRLPPNEHPLYQQVRFLETEPTGEVGRMDVSAEVRRMARPDLIAEHAKELAALLAIHPEADVGPLLSILDGAGSPGWMFWRRARPVDQVVAALTALSPLRGPAIDHRVRKLVGHRDPTVSQAARDWVEAAVQ